MTMAINKEQCLNIADQCAATATSDLAASILVDGGNGTLRQLLNDAADAIRAGWVTPSVAHGDTEDAARWRDWAAAVAEASANGECDTPFMRAFSDAIGDSEAPFTTEQFAAWVDAARKQGGKV